MEHNINIDALRKTQKWLEDLRNFIQDKFSYDFKGASVLIIIDHSKSADVGTTIKLIDLPCVIKYDDDNERDSGFILGLTTMIEHLEKFDQMIF